MTQEIEIEFKLMLEEPEYNQLVAQLPFNGESINQTNYYFETTDFALKKNKCALRIRKKADQYILTLKEPHELGILETHDSLTEEEFHAWLDNQARTPKAVKKQLDQLGIRVEELRYMGSLRTERKVFCENGLEYVLDKSYYNGIIDFELEIEAPSKRAGEQALQEIINNYQIKGNQSITKIERFFATLKHN